MGNWMDWIIPCPVSKEMSREQLIIPALPLEMVVPQNEKLHHDTHFCGKRDRAEWFSFWIFPFDVEIYVEMSRGRGNPWGSGGKGVQG